ncbi:potassium channel family protein [Terrabacter sp. NPDC000476]|uniref:potassium channel family protein n=1 Tax=Terrabacter sp. NPDC000476 TaxID=3154258 RepID=UPI00333407A2
MTAPAPRRQGTSAGNRLFDRFDLVLLLVLAVIVSQALVDTRGSVWGSLVTHATTGLALVVATRASAARRRVRRVLDVLVVVTLVSNVLLLLPAGGQPVPPDALQPEGVWLGAAVVLPVIIGRRLLEHPVVRVQTVLGAVAAYLQIAVAYATLFQTVDGLTPTHFFGEQVSTTAYTYFSLTTISTVGYGDLVAATDLARLAATSEAVVGQVFLVTFVALIVSRFAAGPGRGARGARHDADLADE